MIGLALILFFTLGIVAIIDWKFLSIPSIFLTGILFVTATANFYFYGINVIGFGVLSLIISLLLYESDFIGGVADIKVITIIGLMIPSIQYFMIFLVLLLFFGIFYKSIFLFILKRSPEEKVPFIPCLYSIYLVMFFIGGLL